MRQLQPCAPLTRLGVCESWAAERLALSPVGLKHGNDFSQKWHCLPFVNICCVHHHRLAPVCSSVFSLFFTINLSVNTFWFFSSANSFLCSS